MSNLSQEPSEMNQTPFAEHYRIASEALLDGLTPGMSLEWYGETFAYAYGQAVLASRFGATDIEIELAQTLARDIREIALEYGGVRVVDNRHE